MQSHAIVTQSHATLRRVMQRYARSCNAKQGHATPPKSCNVLQSYAIMQGKASHTPQLEQVLLSCRDVSPVFSPFQANGERWLFTTGEVVVYQRRAKADQAGVCDLPCLA